ncbi:putative hedgehog receptor, partial [Operophtera brumata]
MVDPNSEASSNPRIVAATNESPVAVEARHSADLYIRTSWVDAALALSELEKGNIEGGRTSLWIRAWLQEQLFILGCFLQGDAGKVLFVAILVLSTFCVGLKSAQIHSRVDQLWVQEGGRLEAELQYTAKVLGEADSSTHQLIIQTAKDPDVSLLHAGALLEHLKVVHAATLVSVHMYDIEWRLKDLCYSPSIPDFEAYHIEKIFDNIIPCAIITPLDCFWEGSKLLGPEYPIYVPGLNFKFQWTHLNPQEIVEKVRKMKVQFPLSTMEAYMKRAGITTAYMKKPCLDPTDALCPETAPNKKSGQIPDVAAELSHGCYGFAAAYMHWPEQLIVGGATRNVTSALRSARALQSVVQLMGEREMYEYWADHYKVHHVGWTQEKAAAVLDSWQRKFAAEVRRMTTTESVSPSYSFYPFSTSTLNDILGKFSELSLKNIILGYMFMLIYVAVTLMQWQDPVRSQAGVGIAGVLLLSITVAAGLGFCALLGLGVQDMFLLTHTYVEQAGDVPREERTGLVLKKSGLSVLLASLCNVMAFLAAALLPIPALRVFCLQAAILLLFNLGAMLLVFPAMISLDLRRRSASRLTGKIPQNNHWTLKRPATQQLNLAASASLSRNGRGTNTLRSLCGHLSSVWGATKVRDGLDLTDIVPENTDEHEFLYRQEKYFGFYSMYAVTQGDFEYPTNQKLLYEYHDQFVRIPNIIKNDNGGLTKFWLSLFRDWLLDLQAVYDKEVESGCITQERWFKNASDEGILAYKLMVQTGHVDNPIAKSLFTKDTKNGHRLVDKDGIIDSKAFYNYLSAWATNDALAYGASQGNLKPQPKRWMHLPDELDLKIPKSSPLIYTQLPFYLSGLSDTESIKVLITAVRELCIKFETKGLSNFPSGIPFLFWEQYLHLRTSLMLALTCALAAVFVLCSNLIVTRIPDKTIFLLATEYVYLGDIFYSSEEKIFKVITPTA